ncbi:MAG: TSUP family transporter [Spirochaetales bacterium]|nr:TSUP family transporter [Spirochaetales bacterium]
MVDLTWTSYLLIFLGGAGAGFIDSIAGGGGMITLPVLLAVGLPPHLALGTNKLQSPFGTLTSTLRYGRSGLFDFRKIWPGVIFTFAGAMAGTILIQRISADFLEKAVPLLLGGIFVYTLAKKDMGAREEKSRMGSLPFLACFGLLLGFYDGFFGPGTGSFWTIAFVSLMGMNLKGATGASKPMNLTSNLTALLFFLIGGNVVLSVGLLMALGQILGTLAGSHLVIKRPPRFVRYALLIIVGATILNTFRQFYLS